jgi:hypothetical protein
MMQGLCLTTPSERLDEVCQSVAINLRDDLLVEDSRVTAAPVEVTTKICGRPAVAAVIEDIVEAVTPRPSKAGDWSNNGSSALARDG